MGYTPLKHRFIVSQSRVTRQLYELQDLQAIRVMVRAHLATSSASLGLWVAWSLLSAVGIAWAVSGMQVEVSPYSLSAVNPGLCNTISPGDSGSLVTLEETGAEESGLRLQVSRSSHG